MNKKIVNINGIKVTLIDTNKFKSVCGGMFFKMPIKKEMITLRTILRNILIHTCKKYPTNKLLNINCIENYDATYTSNFRRDGNYATSFFMFRTLNEEYTDKDNLKRVLDTFKEIIFNPNVKKDSFDNEEYDFFYRILETKIKTRKENARNYSFYKMCKQMGENTPISYTTSIDILEKITNKDLYKEYLNMIENSEVSFVVAGNNVTKLDFKDFLKDIKTRNYDDDLYITSKISKEKNIVEEYDGMQSTLLIGLKLEDLSEYEKSYVIPIYNNILGGGTSSRLFNIIREKNSLCYSCFSRYEKDDSLIEIYAGIENDNYKKTLLLTKDIVRGMNKITEEELKSAKTDIITVIEESFDSLPNYVVPTYLDNLYNADSVDKKIDNIKKVTLEDLKKVYKKVYLTDTFFLKGGKTDE